jgi:hypothetical protein
MARTTDCLHIVIHHLAKSLQAGSQAKRLKLIFNSAIYEVIDRQQQSAPRGRLGTTFQLLGSG